MTVELRQEQLEQLADLVADRLDGRRLRGRLADVRETAEHLGVSRTFLYEHAAQLGAVRLGSGPKAPLRFDLSTVVERLSACQASRKSPAADSAPRAASRPRRARRMGTSVVLLPIRGTQTGPEAGSAA